MNYVMYHRYAIKRLTTALAQHHHRVRRSFGARYPHVVRTLHRHGVRLHALRKHIAKGAGMAALASVVALSPIINPAKDQITAPANGDKNNQLQANAETNESMVGKLQHALSLQQNGHIPLEEEQAITDSLSKRFGVNVSAELDGHRLNRVTGMIGGEQHLKRYPGDVISTHATDEDKRPQLAGMAPGLGAYGYFAASKNDFNDEAAARERYYIAAQTFLAPGWDKNPQALYEFFRFRKMLVVNSHTGQAVVVVIGDAGPSAWTGKSFGGSPEVMDQVGYGSGPRKGDVFVLFVNDPNNTVPLGPVNVQR